MQSTATVISGLLALGSGDFLAAVEAGRADVVAQMRLAGGRLDRERRAGEVIVRAMHAAPRRRFLVLLDCHGSTPLEITACVESGRASRRKARYSHPPRFPGRYRIRAAAHTAARGSTGPRAGRAPPSPCRRRPDPARSRRPARRRSRPASPPAPAALPPAP